MAATASIDAIEWLRKQIEEAAPDPLKTLLTEMVNLLMSAGSAQPASSGAQGRRARHLRRAPRAEGRDRLGAARRRLAAL